MPAASAQASTPQAPLTVESRLVLVPVFVYDQTRMAKAPQEELPCVRSTVIQFYKLLPTEPYLPRNCDVTQITDLKAENFRLLQDGVRQQIGRVDSAAWWTVVRDNLGWYMQSSDTPRGIWGSGDLTPLRLVPPGINRNFYILEYVPQATSKEGCHHIRVEVDRPNVLVFARNEYCTQQSPSDPLLGTGRGKELERILDSNKHGKIPLTLQTAKFYTRTGKARVDICLEFPWQQLFHSWDLTNWALHARIAVMGVALKKDGTVAARFSDLLYPSYWPTFVQGGEKIKEWIRGTDDLMGESNPGTMREGPEALELLKLIGGSSAIAPNYAAIKTTLDRSDAAWLPTRYETQIDLPPGDYDLKIVLSDEEKFGRAETPLMVDRYVPEQLGLSSVMLCKRLRDAAVAAKEAAAANFAPQYQPLESKEIWFTPAGDTHFARGEPLFAYFEVYESSRARNPGRPLSVHMRLLDANSGRAIANVAPFDAKAYLDRNAAIFRIARKIPIDKLPGGAYRLEVQVSDSLRATTGWGTADFQIDGPS